MSTNYSQRCINKLYNIKLVVVHIQVGEGKTFEICEIFITSLPPQTKTFISHGNYVGKIYLFQFTFFVTPTPLLIRL